MKRFEVVEVSPCGSDVETRMLRWDQDANGNNRLTCETSGEESAWADPAAFAYLPIAGYALFGSHWRGTVPINEPVRLRTVNFQVQET